MRCRGFGFVFGGFFRYFLSICLLVLVVVIICSFFVGLCFFGRVYKDVNRSIGVLGRLERFGRFLGEFYVIRDFFGFGLGV